MSRQLTLTLALALSPNPNPNSNPNPNPNSNPNPNPNSNPNPNPNPNQPAGGAAREGGLLRGEAGALQPDAGEGAEAEAAAELALTSPQVPTVHVDRRQLSAASSPGAATLAWASDAAAAAAAATATAAAAAATATAAADDDSPVSLATHRAAQGRQSSRAELTTSRAELVISEGELLSGWSRH